MSTFFVEIYPRPCKIAFLINPHDCPSLLLDSIIEFNTRTWGGRYNPIIPVSKGEINESYWDLLKFSDPDIIYCYLGLKRYLIERIDKEISPYYLIDHKLFGATSSDHYKYNVTLRGQIHSKNLYPHFNDIFKQIDPISKPKLLIYNGSKRGKYYSSILRNFGVINDVSLENRIPEKIETVKIDQNHRINEILKTIAKFRALVTPIQLAEVNSYYYEPEYNSDNDNFLIIVGNSIWDWIYCWNRSIALPYHRRKDISQLCIPYSFFDLTNFKSSLKEFLSHRFWPSGTSPGVVDFVSCEIEHSKLDSIARTILDRSNFRHRTREIDTKEFPSFIVYPKRLDFIETKKRLQLSSKHALLPATKPIIFDKLSADSTWMVDLKIEYRPEKFMYTNKNYWWRLPKFSGITKQFYKNKRGRITNEGMISIETQESVQNLEMNIPQDSDVLIPLVTGYKTLFFSNDLRNKYYKEIRIKTVKKQIRFSDKGVYARGVMKLFTNIFYLHSFVENRFWRTVIQNLCHIGPDKEDKFLKPIINRIKKIDKSTW
ncbi:MAG: hypothetical protein JXB26_18360 [Candidatus Aminicenantes bacterium]|nr:hypothetical protein [Candidatus Aminicenantes bacterium]